MIPTSFLYAGNVSGYFPHNPFDRTSSTYFTKNNTVEIYFYSIVFTLHINIEKLSLALNGKVIELFIEN